MAEGESENGEKSVGKIGVSSFCLETFQYDPTFHWRRSTSMPTATPVLCENVVPRKISRFNGRRGPQEIVIVADYRYLDGERQEAMTPESD
jgi:hypothetical protein